MEQNRTIGAESDKEIPPRYVLMGHPQKSVRRDPPEKTAVRSMRSAANRSERASGSGGYGPCSLIDRQRQRHFIPYNTCDDKRFDSVF